jgi:hypothetical protein
LQKKNFSSKNFDFDFAAEISIQNTSQKKIRTKIKELLGPIRQG